MAAIAFLEQAGFVVLFLFLTQRYLPEDRALGVAFAGFVIMTFGLTKLAAQAPAGWLADRLGYRTALVLGLCTSLLAMTAMMTWSQPWVFLAATGLYSLGKAPVGPALNATLANLFGEEDRGKAVAYLNVANLLAYAVAGLGGFLALDAMSMPVAYAASMVLTTTAALVAVFFLAETSFLATVRSRAWRPALPFRELMDPHVLTWGAIVLLLGIGMGLMGPLARPYVRDVLGIELRQLVPYLALPGVLAALTVVPFGHAADNLGRMRPLVLGLGLGVVGLLGVAMTTSLLAIMGLTCFIMLSYTMTSPAVGAALMDVTREETRGFVLGALATVQGVGGALGPAIGGSIYQAWTPQDVFIVAAAVLGGALLLAAVYGGRRQLAYAFSPVFVRQ
ncbi:MAG TPA: MFS transporter [Dehalococcoidia bacterium]|nr:MFS transporter [Dehalococcoidia bacterium]